MIIPLRYTASLLTPTGRLPKGAFLVLGVGLMISHLLVFQQVMAGTSTSRGYMVALLVLTWMSFCVMSSRMRDIGASGYILVPCFMAAVAVFLVSFDPSLAETAMLTDGSADSTASLRQLCAHSVSIVRGIYVVLFLYLARANTIAPSADLSAPYFSERARSSRDAISRLGSLGQLAPTAPADTAPAAVSAPPRRPSLGRVPAVKPFSKRG